MPVIDQGERASFDFTVLNTSTGDPLVLTGSTLRAALFTANEVIYESSSADGYDANGYGLEITDSDAGEAVWILPPYISKTLAPGGTYYYQVWRTASGIDEPVNEATAITVKRSLNGL